MYCYEVLHDHLLDNLTAVLNDSIVAVRNDPKNWTHLGMFCGLIEFAN